MHAHHIRRLLGRRRATLVRKIFLRMAVGARTVQLSATAMPPLGCVEPRLLLAAPTPLVLAAPASRLCAFVPCTRLAFCTSRDAHVNRLARARALQPARCSRLAFSRASFRLACAIGASPRAFEDASQRVVRYVWVSACETWTVRSGAVRHTAPAGTGSGRRAGAGAGRWCGVSISIRRAA